MKKQLWTLMLVFCAALFLAASGAAVAPKSSWAVFDGNKVHHYDIGKPRSKSAVIFIHGWTCNADFWKDSLSAFPKYRVIALDLPGHGKSDKPQASYSMEYFARSVDAVMKNANVERAVLIGHSMGTPISRQFYRLYPERTLGLVAVDGLLIPIGTPEQMAEFFTPIRTNFKENAPKFVGGMIDPMKDEKLKKMIRDTMTSAPEHVAVSAMTGMVDPAIWTNDTVKVPVLAIMAASPWWTPDTKDKFQAVAPNIEFQLWNGVTHFLMMEKPKEFNETVRSWIERKTLL